jgi:hypothetical protein
LKKKVGKENFFNGVIKDKDFAQNKKSLPVGADVPDGPHPFTTKQKRDMEKILFHISFSFLISKFLKGVRGKLFSKSFLR